MSLQLKREIKDEKNKDILDFLGNLVQQKFQGPPLLIGITGAGGAGKTTLATNLCAFIGSHQSVAIDLDDYLLPREYRAKLEITGYNPLANKLRLAKQHLEELKQAKPIIKPTYSHKTGTNLPNENVAPKHIIIAEGVTTLYPELSGLSDISIFLDAPDQTQIKSRITRDVNERGYTLEEALQLFHAILPDYKRFVVPTKKFADIVCHVSKEYELNLSYTSDRVR